VQRRCAAATTTLDRRESAPAAEDNDDLDRKPRSWQRPEAEMVELAMTWTGSFKLRDDWGQK